VKLNIICAYVEINATQVQ